MRAAAKNIARPGEVCDQGNRNGRASRIQPTSLFEQLGRELWVFEINDESVKLLPLQTLDGVGENGKTLHRDPTGRQSPAQDLGSAIVARNQ
jgi:hypothetical protein